MSEFIDNIKKTIKHRGMLAPGDRVIVAWSGGPDSTALLVTLARLADELEIEVSAFHLNHMLRKESAAEAVFAQSFAARAGIKVTIAKADVAALSRRNKTSIQMAARDIRYKMLKKEAQRIGADKVATGHHSDDVAETVWMRLLGGSGLSGLTGIPPVRDGWIIRPLIDVTRDEVMNFLDEENILYVTDNSNFDDKYLRNRIRNRLLPVLNEISPDLKGTVLSLSENLSADESRLSSLALHVFDQLAKTETGAVIIAKDELIAKGAAIGRRVIRLAVSQLSDARLDAKNLLIAWDAVVTGGGGKDIGAGISICHEGDQVVIFSRTGTGVEEKELAPGDSVNLPDGSSIELSIESGNAFPPGNDSLAVTDADSINWPLRVRAFHQGDRFVPLGMNGQKKVHDYFVDEKVPRRLRPSVPIVCDNSKIVWIAGHRIDDRVKVTKKTERIAVMKLTGKGITER